MIKSYYWTNGLDRIGVFRIDVENDIWEYRSIMPSSGQPDFEFMGKNTKDEIKKWAKYRTPEYSSVMQEGFFVKNKEFIESNDRLGLFINEKGRFADDFFYLEEIDE